MSITPRTPETIATPIDPAAEPLPSRALQRPWKRLALALAVAGISDLLSLAVALILPVQWALDLATALLLFLILGRRWALLPGLIAEAIPGMGLLPAWFLVVVSIILYDDIRGKQRQRA